MMKIDRFELGLVVGGLIIPFVLLRMFLSRFRNGKNELNTWTINWLLLCAVVHSYLELSFIFFRNGPIARAMDLYGAADFRYGREVEAGTAAMETITALIDGPLAVLLAYGIIAHRPWRHVVQLILSVCQIYGLVWFLLHPVFYHLEVASSDPFLFWVIFVGLNAPWGIFPPVLVYKSWTAITKQFAINEKPQTNGKKAQ